MEVVIYTKELERVLYTFLEERIVLYPIPTHTLYIEDGDVICWFTRNKRTKKVENILKGFNLIKEIRCDKVFFNMGLILRYSFSDFKIMKDGVKFSNPVEEGVDEYIYANEECDNDDMEQNLSNIENSIFIKGANYLHSYIKLSARCIKAQENVHDYRLIYKNNHNRYLTSNV